MTADKNQSPLIVAAAGSTFTVLGTEGDWYRVTREPNSKVSGLCDPWKVYGYAGTRVMKSADGL